MNRKLALKIVLGLVGVLFIAMAYPMGSLMRRDPAAAMMGSLYVTLGVFLLLAIREPAAHRSLIAFTAWSSLAHAGVMAVQEQLKMIGSQELIGVVALGAIGVVLLGLAPAKQVVAERRDVQIGVSGS